MTAGEEPTAAAEPDAAADPETAEDAAADAVIDADAADADAAAAGGTGEAPAEGGAPVGVRSGVRQALDWCRGHLMGTVAVGLVLVSAVAAASVYWWLYRPDRLTDTAARQQVVAAAKEGTEALLTYSPENLDADLANAKSHLTGDFLNYYTDFTDTVVAPASRDKGVKTEANVARAAVSEIRPGTADVLVFVNQVTTSKERPTPALSTSSVMVTLERSGDRWLISAFNPV